MIKKRTFSIELKKNKLSKLKTTNTKNAERCVIGLFQCSKINLNYLSAELRTKVKSKIASDNEQDKLKISREKRSVELGKIESERQFLKSKRRWEEKRALREQERAQKLEEVQEENIYSGRDQTTYKGKTYTASRICPEGKKMYWQAVGGFLKKTKVEELGCMTKDQNEEYWRYVKLRRTKRSRGLGGSDTFFIEQKIHTQQMLNDYNRSLDNYRNNMGY